jgi:hypothetical protein
MKAVLLRVGIDSGAGGIQGPLFADGSFEFVPIPHNGLGEERTYGNTRGRHGRFLVEYFPTSQHAGMADRPIHLDPEFDTWTYGDLLKTPKAKLRDLDEDDMLIFYSGLQAWPSRDSDEPDALYLIGYLEVELAGTANTLKDRKVNIQRVFANNAHVRNQHLYQEEMSKLVLVKGRSADAHPRHPSRLLSRAKKISEDGMDCRGRRLKVLSREMHEIFGDLGGRNSLQRSTPRWIDKNVDSVIEFMRGLP